MGTSVETPQQGERTPSTIHRFLNAICIANHQNIPFTSSFQLSSYHWRYNYSEPRSIELHYNSAHQKVCIASKSIKPAYQIDGTFHSLVLKIGCFATT